MARLNRKETEEYLKILQNSQATLFVCGLDLKQDSLSKRMSGVAGVLDWWAHGRVSKILGQGKDDGQNPILVPRSGSNSILFFPYSAPSDTNKLCASIVATKANKVCIAVDSFPKDFFSKLKHNLEKEGVSCQTL